jgi:hypothetical protein
MIFGYFTLLVAIVISSVAEYYSIVGLTAIFSAAFWPVVIMGASLGVGKIAGAVWLKINWHRAPLAYKLYLVPAVGFLMLLTALGCFGFLSKAHSDQNLISGDAESKIAIYDEKIKIARENIDANRKALKQMDEAVDQVMGRSNDEKGADKAVAIRRGQLKERQRLQSEITIEQTRINKLSEERAPIAAELRKVEAEVGPIKYVAAFIYGDNPDSNLLERAVRWVIIIIVFVFDPLAVILILAGQQSIRWAKEEKLKENQIIPKTEIVTPPIIPEKANIVIENIDVSNTANDLIAEIESEPQEFVPPTYESDDGPLIPEQIKQIKESVTPVTEFDRAWPYPKPEKSLSIIEQYPYLNNKSSHFKNTIPIVATPTIEKIDIEKEEPLELTLNYDEDEQSLFTENKSISSEAETNILPEGTSGLMMPEAKDPPPKQIALTMTEAFDLKEQQKQIVQEQVNDPDEIRANFGTVFPTSPGKGELFLKVDHLPTRLFRFNGDKWIEVEKSLTDTYSYNEEYIVYLIEKLSSGQYELEDLSSSEQAQIEEYLNKNSSNN